MNRLNLTTSEITKIQNLYFGNTKHSSYQPVPEILRPFFTNLKIDEKWRHPGPRIDLLKLELANFTDRDVIEIGSNTGFQIIELAKQFPNCAFKGFEISRSHVEFIKRCIEYENINNVEIYNSEFQQPGNGKPNEGAILLDFNVVHHAGSDFQNETAVDTETWWNKVLPNWLSCVPRFSNYWFSSGFRLGGNLDHPLSDPESPSLFITRVINCVKDIDANTLTDVFVISYNQKSGKLFYRKLNLLELDSIDNQLAELRKTGVYKGEYFTRPIFHFYRNAQ